MTAPTHYAFSFLLNSLLGVPALTALFSCIASLLPDIDHPDSLVGRIFPGLSKKLLVKWGHRTTTHSFFAIAVFCVASLPFLLLGKTVYVAVTASFISHIFLDLFNRSGVKLFSPFHAKEYISFHTEKLRIRVKSWQEYLILFLIIISCVMVSGETLSMNKAARTLTRFFYKHYDGAYSDFKIYSEDICFADVDYFDPVLSKIVKGKFMVLSMFPEKGYFLKCSSSGEPDFSSHNRLIISKEEVSEIELSDSGIKRQQKNLRGRSLRELAALPPDCIISGTIKLKNYRPDIKNSDYIRVSHSPTESTITLICAMSGELGEIIELERMRNAELDTLKAKLPSYQIERLQAERERIENQIRSYNRKGFYSNYKAIIRLNDKIKKIDSRIDSLSMQDSAGADDTVSSQISMMESSFAVEWNVWVLEK
ncbi:MAG TPA: metal-dependent hydrolase [Spirochaetota bacterium]|nr:metal-dependent hydrolase [Spirochaetota bacterium]